jgi:hypothetical protein
MKMKKNIALFLVGACLISCQQEKTASLGSGQKNTLSEQEEITNPENNEGKKDESAIDVARQHFAEALQEANDSLEVIPPENSDGRSELPNPPDLTGPGSIASFPLGRIDLADNQKFHELYRWTKESFIDLGSHEISAYDCSKKKYSAPELVIPFKVSGDMLVTALLEQAGAVDFDLMIVEVKGDEKKCLSFGETYLQTTLSAGQYFLVIDIPGNPAGSEGSWEEKIGDATMRLALRPIPTIDCSFVPTTMGMRWKSCAPEMANCRETKNEEGVVTATSLKLPAYGLIVKEAHLVTNSEPSFPDATCNGPATDWPQKINAMIKAHYLHSEKETAYVQPRVGVWAPRERSRFGQAARCSPAPVIDEAWYVNMQWKKRPAGGTPMLVTSRDKKRAVLVSAGHETGPSRNTRVGGVTEEVHHYMKTKHLSSMNLGFPKDLPAGIEFGPVNCAQ